MKGNTDYIDRTSQRSPIINFARFFFQIKQIDADYNYTSICKRVIEYHLKLINSANVFYAIEEYNRNIMILQRNYGRIVNTVVLDLELQSIGESAPKRNREEREYERETGKPTAKYYKLGGSRKNTTRRKKPYTNKRTQNSSKTKHHTKKRTHHSSKTKRKVKASMHSRRTHKK